MWIMSGRTADIPAPNMRLSTRLGENIGNNFHILRRLRARESSSEMSR